MKTNLRHSLNHVFYGGIAQSAMDTLATGSILTAYALLLGAGNFEIGILGAVPFIGNLIHIFVSWLLEKGYSVKQISVLSSFMARPFYLLAAGLVFFEGQSWAVPALILFLIGAYCIGNIAGGAWRPWMKELVPDSIMGRFFAHRFRYMMVAKIVCFTVAYFMLKYVQDYAPQNEIDVYAILLIIAFCIGLYGAYTLTQVQDVVLNRRMEMSFIQKVLFSLKNKPFVQMMSALGSLNFAVNFVTPFITVFMLEQLDIPMSTVILLTVFSWVVYTIIIKKQGRLADKAGPHILLYTSLPMFIIALLVFALLNAGYLTGYGLVIGLLVAHLFWGVGTAGIALGTNNLSLLYVPKKSSSVYLAVNGSGIAFMGAMGSIVGGVVISVCENIADKWQSPFASWYLFFGLSALLSLGAMVQFKRLKRSDSVV